MIKQNPISHSLQELNVNKIYQETKERIQSGQVSQLHSVEKQLSVLEDLYHSEVGSFILANKGVNGFWTYIFLSFDKKDSAFNMYNVNETTDFIFRHAPTAIATRQRHKIFLRENQQKLFDNSHLCCVPAGLTGELLQLDFSSIKNCTISAIDIDDSAFLLSKTIWEESDCKKYIKFVCQDAWQMEDQQVFDLISCNGLTIYEPKDRKVAELYKRFHDALKPGGKLVTSYVTPPPSLDKQCEWDFSNINEEDLKFQNLIFTDIIGVRWQCFRKTDLTISLLRGAGFQNIEIMYDEARIFPTVVCYK